MQNITDLKLGIIGTNFISDWLVDAAKRLGITPAAVFSRKHETGKAFAEKHGIPYNFSDFDEFVKTDKINAAYVASPNFCHAQQSASLLSEGKHVLCEKPAASNLNEFKEVRRLAQNKGLVYIEAMRPAYDAALDEVKKLIPACGKLRYCNFEYSQYSSRYDRFKAGIMTNAFDPSLSNAAVMDIGVYPLHMCILLFGKPEKVISHSVKLENGFEGQGNVLLCYGDMTCNITYSKITEAASPSFIRGEDGEIKFGKALSKINGISFAKKGEKEISTGFCPAENNMVFELNAFCDFISGKKDPKEYLDATENTIAVIDEIRRQNGIVFPADKA